MPRLNSTDRAILRLAIPALGSLAADPLYSLVDTALVGHLGRAQLGGVAVGSAAFTASFWLFSFLAYGVTPRVARALGEGDTESASKVGAQALLLAVCIGGLVTLIGFALAGPIIRALGGEGAVATFGIPYLQIRALSMIPLLVELVGHGWLRGAHDTRTPMYIAITGSAANAIIGYLLIYPLGWGVEGAASGTVIAHIGAALAFVVVLRKRMLRLPWRVDWTTMRSLFRVSGELILRSGALVAGITFATAIAARMGEVALSGWQVAMQVFTFLALTLDSVAIAAQAMIGRSIGVGQRSETIAISKRLMTWGLGLGIVLGITLFAFRQPLASVFTEDQSVVAASVLLLAWVAVTHPLSAAAFMLDGILIGASDTRVLALGMLAASAVFVGACAIALQVEAGVTGLAISLTAWLAVRTAIFSKRLMGAKWLLANSS